MLTRMVNEVQFKANMTSECARTRSLVADLLELNRQNAKRFLCDSLINHASFEARCNWNDRRDLPHMAKK